jgi:hypothetical protein
MFGKDQLEDGVSEEFQPLIVEMMPLGLVPKARMRQGFRQQERISKLVADALL